MRLLPESDGDLAHVLSRLERELHLLASARVVDDDVEDALGSAISRRVRRALPTRGVLPPELWTWPTPLVFLVWPNVRILAASLILPALAIPSTDPVVLGYQLALTPDRLIDRVASVFRTIVLLVAPLGPLLAGFLLGANSPRLAVACSVAVAALAAVVATLSPALRSEPSGREDDPNARDPGALPEPTA